MPASERDVHGYSLGKLGTLSHDGGGIYGMTVPRNIEAGSVGARNDRIDRPRPTTDVGCLVRLWLSCGLHEVPDEGDLLVTHNDNEVAVGVGRAGMDNLGAQSAQVHIRHERYGVVDLEVGTVS